MFRGLVVQMSFSTPHALDRFKRWVFRGNKRIPALGLGALGLQGHLFKLPSETFIFCLEHSLFFNFSLVMRLALHAVMWNVRKDVNISFISKVELCSYAGSLSKVVEE